MRFSQVENVGESSSPTPFASVAMYYHKLGLSIIPCGGENGKKALVAWKRYQKKQASLATIKRWMAEFPNCNIGIITGSLSNITVVDCDFISDTPQQAIDEFGDTPLICKTPRGGFHLYYRFNGERNRSYKPLQVDIRGEGGYVVAPPSYSSLHARNYHFIKGDIGAFKKQSMFIKKSLRNSDSPKNTTARSERKIQDKMATGIERGERNNFLFNKLRIEAIKATAIEELQQRAATINQKEFIEPLSQNEVNSTVSSVWGMKIRNTLILPNEGYATLKAGEIEKLSSRPYAMALLVNLRYYHEGVRSYFVIDQKVYSKKVGWSRGRLKKAINELLMLGFVKLLRRGNNSPNIYSFL